MIRLQKFAQLHSIISFLKCSLVVAYLLSSLTSHVGSVLGLRDLERLEVVWPYAILVRPKHSDERSVATLFPLVFPAVVVDLDHHLILDPLVDFDWSSFSELLNEVLFALLLIVDSCLLEMVNYPLVVRGGYLNVVSDQLLYLFFRYLVILVFEAPILFSSVLDIVVDGVKVPNVAIWHNGLEISGAQLLVFEKVVWIL
jgi:hypothetical protein